MEEGKVALIAVFDELLNNPTYRSQTIHPEKIFALVIGIDQYLGSAPPLHGCITDSKNMVDYLRTKLRVQDDNIRHLYKPADVTRKSIIKAFQDLYGPNSKIKRGDIIVMYFSGHGGRQEVEDYRISEGNKVEVICPIDASSAGGIPDYTLAGHLRRLQHEKGDNITVIFDCCHSGGMARDEAHAVGDGTPRIYDPPMKISTDIDSNIWSWSNDGSREHVKPEIPGSMQNAITAGSAVFLTACSPKQLSWERDQKIRDKMVRCGAFTTALINVLPQSVSEENITHVTAIDSLPVLEKQLPCCLGSHEHRYLFTDHFDEGGHGQFNFIGSKTTLYVTAGDIHGVVPGTVFKPVGAKYAFKLQVTDKVTLHRCSVRLIDISEKIEIQSYLRLPVTRVDISPKVDDRHLSYSIGDAHSKVLSGSVKLLRDDPLMNRFCRVIEPINFQNISHFNYYLYHRPTATLLLESRGIELPVTVSVMELELESVPGPFGEDHEQYRPCEESQNLFVRNDTATDYVAEALLSASKTYGFQVENRSRRELFLYIFYFDPAKYTIEVLYFSKYAVPAKAAGSSDHILKLLHPTDPGWEPHQFPLPRGLKRDSGFLKIFTSTKRVDLSNIAPPPSVESPRGSHTMPRLSMQGSAPALWNSWVYVLTSTVDDSE